MGLPSQFRSNALPAMACRPAPLAMMAFCIEAVENNSVESKLRVNEKLKI